MKNFKKAIAILLAVLMVAFSVPFTATAASISDNDYSQVVVKLHVTPYVSSTEYGYLTSSTAKDLDPSNISFDDLTADHMIAVYITTENLLAADTANLVWYFDPNVLSPVYPTGSCKNDPSDLLYAPSNTGYVTAANDISNFNESCNISFSQGEFDCSAQTETTFAGGTIDGIVWGVFAFEVLSDNADITWTYDTTEGQYGWDTDGMTSLDDAFYPDDGFTCGYAPATPVAADPVTYTFIDSSTTTVTDGSTPNNTAATAWVAGSGVNAGKHIRTAYSWTKDSNTAYHEVGATETENCNSDSVVTAEVPAVHTQDTLTNGTTAVTKCSVCGGNQQGGDPIVAAHTPALDESTVVAATCVSGGYTGDTKCTVCGLVTTSGTTTGVDPTNHVNTTNHDAVTATCVIEGFSAGTYCEDCHTWVSGHVSAGTDANNHVNTTNHDAVTATCKTEGFTAGTYCEDCKTWISGHVSTGTDENAHVWEKDTTLSTATCNTLGNIVETCSVCSAHRTVETNVLDASNHAGTATLDESTVVAATCISGGYTGDKKCSACQAVLEQGTDTDINPSNHVNTTNHDAVAATCVSGGYTAGTYCEDCQTWVSGHTSTGVNANNHVNTTNYDAVTATCVTEGFTAGTYCEDCDTWVSGHVSTGTNANNHEGTATLDESTVVTATCVSGGYTGDKKCSACQAVVEQGTDTAVDSTNHEGPIVLDESTVVAATATTGGYTGDKVCQACGEVAVAGQNTDPTGSSGGSHSGSSSGKPMQSGWVLEGNTWVLYKDGEATTGWQYVGGKWYYMNNNGAMQTGWVWYNGAWYYLNANGAMAIGWQMIDGKWYHFNNSGAAAQGWRQVNGKWYYFNICAMQTGWRLLNGKWYYLNTDGSMRTANLTYKGKVYKFNNSGACINP